ncbi:MAG TPA: M48 family metallopeptidase [Desulfobacterales bacterium]|nr:M48 family metallopeptidase [Desulfobacterales bacterium]
MTVFRNRIGLVCFFLLFLLSCSTVPITGRKQLSLISDSSMLSMSFQQYSEFLKSNKLSSNQEQTQMVKRVGDRLKKAVERYFIENKMADELKNYAWEFNLVENSEVNAWCMPGGKVVVYTGILPITRDEAGLAVVMGHEIAHAIAKHGGERMSHALAVQMGGIALSTAVASQPAQTQNLWMQVFGVGSQYGFMLPYSRLQENEADHLGLIFMAMAGYDPHAAIGFWERMSQKKGGGTPEFLSTHPADATRIQNIRKLIPDAMRYYGTGR